MEGSITQGDRVWWKPDYLGEEWEQKAGEEMAASCPGERSCSGRETGGIHVGIARGSFLEDVVR